MTNDELLNFLMYDFSDMELFSLSIRVSTGCLTEEDRYSLQSWFPGVQHHVATLALSTFLLVATVRRAISYSPHIDANQRIELQNIR